LAARRSELRRAALLAPEKGPARLAHRLRNRLSSAPRCCRSDERFVTPIVHTEATMHDIEHTQFELDSEFDAFEDADHEYPESEAGVFGEAEEMELAAELLAVSDEAELDQFLGDLIKKAGQAIGKAVKSPLGHKLGGFLKGAAKKVLPVAAGALGTIVGGPVGGMLASKAASAAGDAFGLELEGLSPEDQEFEAARHFVRFAGEAARHACKTPGGAEPQAAARKAVMKAAHRFAPGLLRAADQAPQSEIAAPPRQHRPMTGRWVREGQRVVLLGL
jgi:hypothetical protein